MYYNKILGGIVGDIIGSTREWNNVKTEDFVLLPQGSCFTDDTVMTLAVAEWLMSDPTHSERALVECMQRLGRKYPYVGYGSMFRFWLYTENPEPYNSFGNGSAMRVSAVGWYAKTLEEAELIAKAKTEIVLIDNYVDVGTLNILAKKRENVKAQIYTVKRTRLSPTDINNFNQQYPVLGVDYTEEFHDRFLIIDGILAYHVGASLKDAGKKCFAINKIEDRANIIDILNRIKKTDNGGTDDGRE